MPNQFDPINGAANNSTFYANKENNSGLLSENSKSSQINGHKFLDNEGLEYFFTKDKDLIDEYIKTRQRVYAEDLGLDGLLGQKDEFDDMERNHSLVLLKDGKCIGGGRITMCYDHNKELLPMENKDFLLKNKAFDLSLQKNAYSEVSRLFVVKNERTARIAGNLYVLLNAKATEWGVKYVFIQAPRMQARSYKIICNRLGIKTTVRNDIEVPRQDYHGNLDKIQVAVFIVNPSVNEIIK